MTTEPKAYTIMLVDDDKFLLDMYNMKFTKAGHVVNAYPSVDEALDALRKGASVDALVFDLVMPKEGGEDLLRAVHEMDGMENIILIALTNQSTDEERKRVEDLGVHEYIIKANMIPSEVVSKIIATIEKKKG